ncbi:MULTISPECIES: 16S rRNA (guanine(527)-N(7))-methyltransferase RsmG [Halomonadaceae]|jgi:16S rRNA (guanine527-N7)-methyltransferase|uniref:16S rRNA (guanine(527)-N(7))-methyltransferase RsmG n=1 Tax=Halomonadaceae TaxID=28256 RepID=UPI0007335D6D|nr:MULTISPECIES: 16S rRNA (guanine(527)-N(7))-methyltransferase RsmG [Halomonas]KTG26796.1 16S rRNA (guanine(527)-N(7))-methyltransferase RsmG [Idiomarina sp. H105]OAF01068.1 16S rRNA (guanine(527)-N(7))-methyltransferase RsmG [Idiomarina sp. WRN-38]MCG7591674.1 16S rRNA (guanine(527)-N(7))-methyltransferase RsmG [Halomonas sp. McD50-5]MCG7617752.1 16S rRNA (guanine(527)-N(7))-methyltransferase RsmG [Halomonas sp. McD50-4]MDP4557572.1 16S rRNA (guanine(527)-N(7))-methyltransferase RsmG [Halomo
MSALQPLIDLLPSGVAPKLDQGLADLGVSVTTTQREQLLGLLALLHKWNRAYNLTAVRDVEEMVSRHVLDSAAVAPYVHGPELLDVGAGPGLPGLVLAIMNPELRVTLLDSNGKKVRFQRQAVMELSLTNVTPTQARVEQFTGQSFDQVISRAFASLVDFVTLTHSLPAADGQWLAMKGPGADDELRELPDGIALSERHLLNVPFETAERQLLILTPKGVA